LVSNAYDLAVAARSVVDDNYGWEVWQMANRYLAQQETSSLETVRLSAGEIWLNTKRLRIRRRLPRPKQRMKPLGLKPRKKEATPGEWARQTTGDAICSYPPEDLVIEDYGCFLKNACVWNPSPLRFWTASTSARRSETGISARSTSVRRTVWPAKSDRSS